MTKPAMNTPLVKAAKTTFVWDDPLLLAFGTTRFY